MSSQPESVLAYMRAWAEELKNMPKPVSYIVLDPNWSPSMPHVDGEDAQGRRYVVFSPAVLDEMQHRKYADLDILSDTREVAARLSAVPVYRREDMPEGWPDAQPEGLTDAEYDEMDGHA